MRHFFPVSKDVYASVNELAGERGICQGDEGGKMKKDGKAENCRLLLFDLDGTLLRSDKTISPRTARALEKCRKRG